MAERQFVMPQPSEPSSSMIRSLTPGEATVLCGGIVAGVVVAIVVAGITGGTSFATVAAGVAVAAVGVWFVKAPYKGRTRYRWWEAERSHKRASGAAWWSRAAERGFTGDGNAREDSAPPGIGRVSWSTITTSRGDAAMLHQVDERVFTVVVEVAGERTFAASDTDEQVSRIDGFAAMLTELGGKVDETLVRRIAWVSRVTPEDPYAHERFVAEVTDPNVDAKWRDSYSDVDDLLRGAGESHHCWLAVSVDAGSELAKRANRFAGGGGIGTKRVVADALEAVIRVVEGTAGLTVLGALDEARLARLIHTSYDPRCRLEDLAGMTRATAWPALVDASAWDYVLARSRSERDSVMLATAWVSGWPRTRVGINFMAPLLVLASTTLPRTTVVVMELEPTMAAYQRTQEERTEHIGASQTKSAGGAIDDPMSAVDGNQMTDVAGDLARGAAGVALSGWVTVAGVDADDLDTSKAAVSSAAANSRGMTLEWADGEQYRALANTLPFCRGLDQ